MIWIQCVRSTRRQVGQRDSVTFSKHRLKSIQIQSVDINAFHPFQFLVLVDAHSNYFWLLVPLALQRFGHLPNKIGVASSMACAARTLQLRQSSWQSRICALIGWLFRKQKERGVQNRQDKMTERFGHFVPGSAKSAIASPCCGINAQKIKKQLGKLESFESLQVVSSKHCRPSLTIWPRHLFFSLSGACLHAMWSKLCDSWGTASFFKTLTFAELRVSLVYLAKVEAPEAGSGQIGVASPRGTTINGSFQL